MKLYISGPMTGIFQFNYPEFDKTEKKLIKAGFEVSNPAQYPAVEGETWEDCLRRDIKDLMDCHGVCTLPNYGMSRGALLETDIARRLSMPIYPLELWLKRGPK